MTIDLEISAADTPSSETGAPVPPPARTRKFLAGITVGYFFQVLVLITGLWLTPFFLRHLGQHDFGLWAVGTQILGYLLLLDLGVFGLLPRETAYAASRTESSNFQGELPALVARVTRLVMLQTPLVAVAALASWYFLPSDWLALRTPLALVLVAFVLFFPVKILQCVLTGLQDLAFLGYLQAAGWTVTTAVTIVLLLAQFRLYALAIGWIAGQALVTAVLVIRTRLRFPHAIPRNLSAASWRDSRGYLGKSLWVTISKAGQVLLNGTDVFIIAKMLGPIAVVPYVCTGKLISVLSSQPQMVMDFAMPGLSQMRYSETRARIRQASTALSQIMLLFSGALVCATLVLNQSFVSWWVGPGLYSGFLLTAVIMATILLRHWSLTLFYTVFCFGHERRLSMITIADGVVTVVSSVILVRMVGPVGAALGRLLGVCLVSLPASLWILARETETTIGSLLVPIRDWTWRVIVLGAAAAFVQKTLVWHSFPAMAAVGCGSLAIYLLIMFPVASTPPASIYVMPLLQGLRSRLSDALKMRKPVPSVPTVSAENVGKHQAMSSQHSALSPQTVQAQGRDFRGHV